MKGEVASFQGQGDWADYISFFFDAFSHSILPTWFHFHWLSDDVSMRGNIFRTPELKDSFIFSDISINNELCITCENEIIAP